MDLSMSHLSNSQKKTFLKFKEEIEDLDLSEYTDITLLKFLRAKSYDVKNAKKNFRENYYSKIIYEANALTETYVMPEVLEKYEGMGYIGLAKNGSPVRYTHVGKLDAYGFVMSMSIQDFCLYMLHFVEKDLKTLKEENERTKRSVDGIIFILDFEGFNIYFLLRKCIIEFSFDSLALFQDCFPEVWKHILIINASTVFDKLFNILRPILQETLVDRLRVAGKNLTKDLLLEYIDENVLPAFLGGNRVDSKGDPLCREFLKFGGLIPESMYGRNQETFLESTQPGVVTRTVGARSCYNYTIAIKDRNGRRMRTVMRSENGSVKITILFREFEESEDPDNPDFPAEDEFIDVTTSKCKYKISTLTIRAQSHCCPSNSTLFLPWPGVYVISYSNIGSWFFSRKLTMRHTLLPA